MRRLIWLPVAGFLLVACAAVAAAAPSALDRAQALLPNAATETPAPTTAPGTPQKTVVDGVLQKVLADLVAKGTITQAQADAITGGIQTEIDNRRAEMQKLREQWQQTRQQLQTFLQDGVITQDEIDTLPADNPLRQAFDSIARNGQVTVDQLQNFLPFGGEFMGKPGFGPMMGPGGMGPGHHGFGGWFDDPDSDGQAPPAPGTSPAP